MPQNEQFLVDLRSALNHLYDPYFLRSSPLVSLFGLGDEPDTPSALQRILNDGIAALEPQPGESIPAQDRRNYELILYRYVQQFGQDEVANQFGVSVRHLRREQNAAIYHLGALLWERYNLGTRPLRADVLEQEEPSAPTITASSGVDPGDDLEWLKESATEEPAFLDQILPAVVDLTRPLAANHTVELAYTLEEAIPALALPPVALRQILLNVISAAVSCARDKKLAITAALEPVQLAPGGEVPVERERRVVIEFAFSPDPGSQDNRGLTQDEKTSLNLAERMARLFQGELSCAFTPEQTHARLSLPTLHLVNVLVIDDNADFLQLILRETSGTRYKASGVRDPLQGLRLAEEQLPDIILLDVMMPRHDGWEILGRLRSHPGTAHIPVIICTILAQEELARSLGARGFLRKPVTRERVLEALDAVGG